MSCSNLHWDFSVEFTAEKWRFDPKKNWDGTVAPAFLGIKPTTNTLGHQVTSQSWCLRLETPQNWETWGPLARLGFYQHKLVGGIEPPTPLKNDGVSSSVGMMTFPTQWKVIEFHGSSHHQPANDGWLMEIDGNWYQPASDIFSQPRNVGILNGPEMG